MFDLADCVILIAGGTGMLGQAITQAAAAAGATVIVPDRGGDVAGKFPDLAASGRHLFLDGIDATSEEANGRMVEQVRERYGRLDALINTVGGYRAGKPPHETELATWDFMMSLNARATFLINRAVIPLMIEGGGGRIINTAARSALAGQAGDAAYAASKSAVIRVTESIAAAYKDQGITANAVLPGNLDTPQNRAAMPEADYSRWVSLDRLAQLYLFLASDAGAVINGALIPAYGRG